MVQRQFGGRPGGEPHIVSRGRGYSAGPSHNVAYGGLEFPFLD